MRKTVVGALVLAAILIAGASLMADEEVPWLDPANCHFCKPLTETEGLMENVGWETHKLSDGMMSITTWTPEWADKAHKCSAAMAKLREEYDPASDVYMCGMCRAFMALPMDKLHMENVEFSGGEISITTSDDPEVVTKLHEMADKTIAAMAAMSESEPAPAGH